MQRQPGTRRLLILRAVIISGCCVIAASCGIPRAVWETLEKRPEFHVLSLDIDGPTEIANGSSASYTVLVEFECRTTGVVKLIRELWDSDFPPFDPDELLSWRRDEIVCQPPPQRTVDTRMLTLHCRDGTVMGADLTDPNGDPIESNSGEGSNPWPLIPKAEIFARAQGSIGPARRSHEMPVRCIEA